MFAPGRTQGCHLEGEKKRDETAKAMKEAFIGECLLRV